MKSKLGSAKVEIIGFYTISFQVVNNRKKFGGVLSGEGGYRSPFELILSQDNILISLKAC
jgi:hypothetical protein